jgi:hypothetical protein
VDPREQEVAPGGEDRDEQDVQQHLIERRPELDGRTERNVDPEPGHRLRKRRQHRPVGEEARDPPDAEAPVRQVPLVQDDPADDLGQSQRGDGEVIGPEPQRRESDEQRQHRRQPERDGQPVHRAEAVADRRVARGHQRRAVRPDTEEGGDAEVDQPAEPPLGVQPERQQRVHPGESDEEQKVRRREPTGEQPEKQHHDGSDDDGRHALLRGRHVVHDAGDVDHFRFPPRRCRSAGRAAPRP